MPEDSWTHCKAMCGRQIKVKNAQKAKQLRKMCLLTSQGKRHLRRQAAIVYATGLTNKKHQHRHNNVNSEIRRVNAADNTVAYNSKWLEERTLNDDCVEDRQPTYPQLTDIQCIKVLNTRLDSAKMCQIHLVTKNTRQA